MPSTPSVCDPPSTKPFLKWAGGKQWVATRIAQLLKDRSHGTYFEPFLGGGSVFFALGPRRAVLSDANPDLIETYAAVQQDVELLIATLKRYPNTKEFFAQIRAARPRTQNRVAARMIYLNKTAFNGLYRVNGDGDFNVPYGRYENPAICQPDRLREAARLLRRARLRPGDFEKILEKAAPGDVAFLDPPYITGHTNNGFHKYNAKLFSWADQERLADVARSLRKRNVTVVASNANHPDVLDLYSGFHINVLQRHSLLGGSKDYRGSVSEALITSFRIKGDILG